MTAHLTILWSPFFPLYVLAALALAALLLVGAGVQRGARGAVLRALLFGLLLLALGNPSILREERAPIKDQALLVIDDSASMRIGDRPAQTAAAIGAVTKKLAGFADLDTETLHVGGETATTLFGAIDTKLASMPRDRLAGVIVLTDGEIHDQPAGRYSAPLHGLIAGQRGEIDRRLIIKQVPAYGIVGQKATLTLRVEDQPQAQSATAAITVTGDNGGSQTVTVPIGTDIPFDVPVAHAGNNLFAFEVAPLPHELTTLNNSAAVGINGIRDRLRVLLVSGAPHIGTRSWRDLLKSDPAVDLIHFTILRSPLKENPVPNDEMSLIAFPVQELFETKLHSFDLVIFDRFGNRNLVPDSYLANIAQYVKDGGGLLVSGNTDGAPDETGTTALGLASLAASPLAEVLPAKPTGALLTGRFVPELTPAGLRQPVTAGLAADRTRNPWGPWFRQVDAKAASGQVLMSGINGAPLLVLDHQGKGRVAQFLSDQFWLWARGYGGERLREAQSETGIPSGGGPQAELTRRVAHWLVGEPALDEAALHAVARHIENGWQLTVTKQSIEAESAHAVVTGPDDQPVQVTLTAGAQPGVLSATVPVGQTGLYHVKDAEREILAWVGPSDAPEFGALVATETALAPAAKDSDGGILWLADHAAPDIRRVGATASAHGATWLGLRRNGLYRVTGSKAYPLWPAWAALAVILAVMLWVWRREGKS